MAANGPKIKLRRLTGVTGISPEKVLQNLEPLMNNTKKQLAQTLYYENNPPHQSPLTRAQKGPVHQRLGYGHKVHLRRMVPLGTNTSMLLPRKKFFKNDTSNNYFRRNAGGNPSQFNQNRVYKTYSAQNRFQRIRSQQHQPLFTGARPIRLRRLNQTPAPSNRLTVEVHNTNCLPQHKGAPIQRFKMILDPQLQLEISDIQLESEKTMGPLPPLTRITPVTTGRKISDIFAQL